MAFCVSLPVAIGNLSFLMTSSSSEKKKKDLEKEEEEEEEFDFRSDGLILAAVLAAVVVFRSSLDLFMTKEVAGSGSSTLEVLVQASSVKRERKKRIHHANFSFLLSSSPTRFTRLEPVIKPKHVGEEKEKGRK